MNNNHSIKYTSVLLHWAIGAIEVGSHPTVLLLTFTLPMHMIYVYFPFVSIVCSLLYQLCSLDYWLDQRPLLALFIVALMRWAISNHVFGDTTDIFSLIAGIVGLLRWKLIYICINKSNRNVPPSWPLTQNIRFTAKCCKFQK